MAASGWSAEVSLCRLGAKNGRSVEWPFGGRAVPRGWGVPSALSAPRRMAPLLTFAFAVESAFAVTFVLRLRLFCGYFCFFYCSIYFFFFLFCNSRGAKKTLTHSRGEKKKKKKVIRFFFLPPFYFGKWRRGKFKLSGSSRGALPPSRAGRMGVYKCICAYICVHIYTYIRTYVGTTFLPPFSSEARRPCRNVGWRKKCELVRSGYAAVTQRFRSCYVAAM